VNIEGALIHQDDLLLLQRGNKGGPNAVVRYAWPALERWLLGDTDEAPEPRVVREYDLGRADGIAFGFTDGAAMPEGGGWLFSAVAEDTDNAFDDGPCAGVALGVVSAEGGLQAMLPLEPCRKVEGIEVRMVQGKVVVGMVTDADDPDEAAEFGTTTLKT